MGDFNQPHARIGGLVVERPVKVIDPSGKEVDAVDVPITDSTERWNDYTLEDGTVVRSKLVAMGIARIDDQFDVDGNPIYLFKGSITQVLVSVPDKLKKKG
jgi:hypothetical protein